MPKYTFVWFILTVISFNTYAQKSIFVVGKVSDTETQESLSYVHIVNLKTKEGTISNQKGKFWIKVEENDYLKVSILGYHSKYFQINSKGNDTLNIQLNKKIFELETIVVYPWTKEQFKYLFQNLNIKKDSLDKLMASLKIPIEELEAVKANANTERNLKNNPKQLTLSLPLFSGYKTKKEKQILGLSKLKRWYEIQEEYWRLAEKITGYKDKELSLFIRYCNFSKNYIMNARDYFLALNLKKKFIEYKNRTKSDSIPRILNK